MANPGEVRQTPLRRTTRFSGEVQGVGFRYQVEQFARNFAVTGYVQNLPNGQVLLELEGPAREIDLLLENIRTHFAPNLSNEESERGQATDQFDRFEIRR